jgi:drug/metabolite transporter (DMT)-like permease
MSTPFSGIVAALAAAVLFGVGAPVGKVLAVRADPLVLAGVLYLGAGLAMTVLRAFRAGHTGEAPLRRADLPVLALVVLSGAVVAPALLLLGLRRVSAVTGSLALNLEAPLTIALAVAFFGEQLGRRAAAGAALILLAAVVLGVDPGPAQGTAVGVLAIAGACLGWAVDNNLTQRLSLRDPLAIVQVKGLVGGTTALGLGLALGGPLPPARLVAQGMLLGALAYGVSVACAVHAMRRIGVARQAALFATAPFVGVLAGVVVLGERFGARELGVGATMIAGVWLVLGERHGHLHAHAPMTHDHRHVHDEHHQHAHHPGDPPGEPHAHEHRHDALVHDHAHVPDLHHRHH